MRDAVLGLIVVLASAAGPASAETRAWEAAKTRLPAKLVTVVSADVDVLRTSTVIQTVLPEIIASHTTVGSAIDRVKRDCGVDPMTAVNGVVVAMGEDERGVVILSLTGVDEAKVAACVKKIAKQEKTVGTAKKLRGRAGIVEYGARGTAEKRYVAWLGKNVVAVATEPGDKALLEAMITGEGAGGDLGDAISRFDHGGAAWGATTSPEILDADTNVKAGYATLAVTGGNATAQASFVFHTTAEAAKQGGEMKKALAKPMKPMTGIPDELVKLWNAMKASHVGDTVSLRVTLPEGDVMALVRLAQSF